MSTDELRWQCKAFAELTTDELYEVMQLRQMVFVVEQHCAYLDADGHDAEAMHLMGSTRGATPRLAAYARLFPPGARCAEAAIGRVVTHPEMRRMGLGRAVMCEAINMVRALFGDAAIRLSAQQYLEGFYTDLGFAIDGDPYDDDGIPHIPMVRIL